jgi:hypothetical protein
MVSFRGSWHQHQPPPHNKLSFAWSILQCPSTYFCYSSLKSIAVVGCTNGSCTGSQQNNLRNTRDCTTWNFKLRFYFIFLSVDQVFEPSGDQCNTTSKRVLAYTSCPLIWTLICVDKAGEWYTERIEGKAFLLFPLKGFRVGVYC